MKEPIAALLIDLLKNNSLRVNEQELEFQLLSHPTYPSLNSVTGVLDHFNVENYALEVPKELETLGLLPNSFITLVKTEDHDGFVLATKYKSGFQLSFGKNKMRFYSKESFLDIWKGIIVIVEGESQTASSNPNKLWAFNIVIYVAIFLLSVFLLRTVNLFQATHLILTLVGIAICILILQHELGLHSKVLDKFCSEGNKKTSCNAVLNSKAATLFNSIKFSDVGIIYFISLLLSWFFLIISNTSYNSIILITLLAIPFTLFSIYYQFRIVKKWCLLCLSVVSILWLQAASLLFIDLDDITFTFSPNGALLTSLSFLTIFALWQFISPKLKKEQELKALKIEHFKFKRNYNIFKSVIEKSEEISTYINSSTEIVFGNKGSSPLRIVIVTNPLCSFCKEAHELVENLLRIQDKNIQITIRFNVKGDSNSVDTKLALKLIEIYNKEGEQECLKAMHDIYGAFKPSEWLDKWGESSEFSLNETLVLTKEWCSKHSLNFTPAILINGRVYPKEYGRLDLLYFIDEIIEDESENNQWQEHEMSTENFNSN